MKRAARQRLWLLLAVLALLLLAGWQWQRDARHAKGNLTTLDPAAVTYVALALPGAPAERYEKRDGHWWRIDGTPTRAVDARLNDLADTAAAPVLSWRPASDFETAKIGLAPPHAVLTLDGQTLEFGEASVTGPQHYVRVGQRIALVSSRYVPRSPATATTALH
ncbi:MULTISPECIES: hypothetical protein [Rhodanobacter]|uniref:hypothetical protein n=1 Tax=Rhodanobacter TaxID=75309 RepID=UPI00041F4442|nr:MULTISPECIES: hypothetical protein [Rhodanobacter]KZC19421.1 hypothetical protein RHOFW104R3_31330 [Rhodanobacter denitrificans]UJJ50704.1 hypothetical protein LRK52_15910 [Rhodanobacter denitrificans]UJM93418.1 hypothetical protein LRK32_15810 [Rhodanobacter denitrificans]UJM96950.1 hypothetical protein LRK44_15820 [Rhodanobacter denitrificans]UJN20223.1 hypothetical protein LRK54_10820 [Rhodanobacter denitrificans]